MQVLGLPPPEPREVSANALGKVDLFGGRFVDLSRDALLEAELNDETAQVVFLSDVHLDSPRVMGSLRLMFEGYSMAAPPSLMILMGNFTSKPMGHSLGATQQFAKLFDDLGSLVSSYPVIAETTHFVLIPGPQDPCAGTALPRPPLPDIVTRGFVDKVPRCTFTSSVARVRFYTQEMVISRHDLVAEMRRNCIVKPSEESADVSEHLVKTVIDEGHLAPLPLHSVPICWAADSALRLYPIPDVLVLADRHDQYDWNYEKCVTFNPGPFHAASAFIVYQVSSRRVEYSAISWHPPSQVFASQEEAAAAAAAAGAGSGPGRHRGGAAGATKPRKPKAPAGTGAPVRVGGSLGEDDAGETIGEVAKASRTGKGKGKGKGASAGAAGAAGAVPDARQRTLNFKPAPRPVETETAAEIELSGDEDSNEDEEQRSARRAAAMSARASARGGTTTARRAAGHPADLDVTIVGDAEAGGDYELLAPGTMMRPRRRILDDDDDDDNNNNDNNDDDDGEVNKGKNKAKDDEDQDDKDGNENESGSSDDEESDSDSESVESRIDEIPE